jgi:hypothetical protein
MQLTISRTLAVAPAVQGVQSAVQKGLDLQAAGLTQGNAALAALVAQLEQLGAGDAAAESQRCSAPCVDLGEYRTLHSTACVCGQGALADMSRDAREAAYHAVWAVVGECCRHPPGLLLCADPACRCHDCEALLGFWRRRSAAWLGAGQMWNAFGM